MDTRKTILLAAAALLVGGALGYYLHQPAPAPASIHRAARPPAATSRPADADAEATIRDLRRRVHELEGRLAAKPAVKEAPIAEDATNGARRAERRWGPPNREEMRARMEKLAKDDPARFAQMTNRFAQMRANHEAREAAKADFLSSIDTTKMTAKAQEVHAQLIALTARQQEIDELMHADGTTDEARETLMQEMRQNRQTLRDLATAERDTLLTQTAESLGYTGDDAATVVDTIKSIYSATETHGGGPGGPPPPGGM